jgi:hypothetical protein
MPENQSEGSCMRRAPVRRRLAQRARTAPSSPTDEPLPIGRHADIPTTSSQVIHKPVIEFISLA